jgi:hypothetical protein
MSKETESLFAAMFALEGVREILRQTAPAHELDEAQKEQVKKALEKVRKALQVIEEWSR